MYLVRKPAFKFVPHPFLWALKIFLLFGAFLILPPHVCPAIVVSYMICLDLFVRLQVTVLLLYLVLTIHYLFDSFCTLPFSCLINIVSPGIQ